MSIPAFDPDVVTVGSLFDSLKQSGANSMSVGFSYGDEKDIHAAIVLIRGEEHCTRILGMIEKDAKSRGDRRLDIHQDGE